MRRRIELGRRCSKPPPLRDCASRGEGGRPLSTTPRTDDIVVGAIRFAGLRRIASRRALERGRAGRVYGVKSGALVPAGVRATLSIGRSARSWAALDYAPALPGEPRRAGAAVRLQACAADTPAFSYDGPVGPITGFPGGFRLKRAGCVPLEVRVAGRPTARARIPFGVGRAAERPRLPAGPTAGMNGGSRPPRRALSAAGAAAARRARPHRPPRGEYGASSSAARSA